MNPSREPSRREKALTKARVPKEEKKYRACSAPRTMKQQKVILQEEADDEEMPLEEEEEKAKEVLPEQ